MTSIARAARSARALTSACLFVMAAAGPLTATAGAVFDRVKATGALWVCIWPDCYGITSRDSRNQRLSGIDIELSAQFLLVQHIQQDGRLETAARHNGLPPTVVR